MGRYLYGIVKIKVYKIFWIGEGRVTVSLSGRVKGSGYDAGSRVFRDGPREVRWEK